MQVRSSSGVVFLGASFLLFLAACLSETVVLECRAAEQGLKAERAAESNRTQSPAVSQLDDGVVLLHARDATTHGEMLRYEPEPHKNCLGYWTKADDWAEWRFHITRPGAYQIELWQGCGKGQGGSQVRIKANGQSFQFTVEETGHFQNFIPRRLGQAYFSRAETYSLAVRPINKKAAAVMDIQKIRLLPVVCDEGAEPVLEDLLDARRVLFLGDSITYGGRYVTDIEAFVRLNYPCAGVEVLNLGLPSETVSGLSEPGHAGGRFPRPDLHERLQRVLERVKPDLVFACYGMNDGIYYPWGEERFTAFKAGMRRLRGAVQDVGADLVHLTPPVFDPLPLKGRTLPAGKEEYRKPYEGYNEVLDRYSEWLLAQRQEGWKVVDVHGPMNRFIQQRRAADPDFRLAGDGVHPNAQGHWLIAREVLSYLGAPREIVTASTDEALLQSHPRGGEMFELIGQRQKLLKDAWLTHTGHQRPGMKKGQPLDIATEKAAVLAVEIFQLAN